MDCSGREQRLVLDQPLDPGRGAIFSADYDHPDRTFHAISRRRRPLRLDQEGIRRISRIRRRLDVLGLHLLLFSGPADGQRGDVRLCRWRRRRAPRAESHVPAGGRVPAAVCRRRAEYRRRGHRQMAAERGRRGNLHSLADARRHGRVPLAHARRGHAFHVAQYFAAVELGHAELLAADRLRVQRARTGVLHERGNPRSAHDVSARHPRVQR